MVQKGKTSNCNNSNKKLMNQPAPITMDILVAAVQSCLNSLWPQGRFFTTWATREAPSARCQGINETLKRSLCSVRVINLSGTALPQHCFTSSTYFILSPNSAAVKPRMGSCLMSSMLLSKTRGKPPAQPSGADFLQSIIPSYFTHFSCSEHCWLLPELSKTTRFCSESGKVS